MTVKSVTKSNGAVEVKQPRRPSVARLEEYKSFLGASIDAPTAGHDKSSLARPPPTRRRTVRLLCDFGR